MKSGMLRIFLYMGHENNRLTIAEGLSGLCEFRTKTAASVNGMAAQR